MRRWHIDKVLLVTSYVLLVLVVAFGAVWIDHEFDDAKRERCLAAALQTELVVIQTEALDLQPEPRAAFDESIDELVRQIRQVCDL